MAFWVGVGAFVTLVAFTVWIHWPVDGWVFDFVEDEDLGNLVTNYVDNRRASEDQMLVAIATEARNGYQQNEGTLNRLWWVHNLALVALGAEVVALLCHVAVD